MYGRIMYPAELKDYNKTFTHDGRWTASGQGMSSDDLAAEKDMATPAAVITDKDMSGWIVRRKYERHFAARNHPCFIEDNWDEIDRLDDLMVTIDRARDSAKENVLRRADLTPDATLADLPESPWYAREVDAEFEVDPIPISASPRVPNGPPRAAHRDALMGAGGVLAAA